MTSREAGAGRERLREVWEELEGSHRKVNLLFNALEFAEDREAALLALDRLSEELEKHFSAEEGADGLYQAIGTDTRGAAAVLADHVHLREVIGTTRDHLASLDRPVSREIHGATFDLGTELRSHERRERALVQRVLGDP